ncbi:MAG: arginine repressor [Myxococcota bacterium]
MSGPKARRLALRQLLLSGQTGTQTELSNLLTERGFETTQSTISRDLKLLGAQRYQREDGEFAYHLRPTEEAAFPADMLLDVTHNETMVVLRTKVGRAQAVGLDLDDMRHPDILGTLAGDDTVLVIPRTIENIDELAQSIRELGGLG